MIEGQNGERDEQQEFVDVSLTLGSPEVVEISEDESREEIQRRLDQFENRNQLIIECAKDLPANDVAAITLAVDALSGAAEVVANATSPYQKRINMAKRQRVMKALALVFALEAHVFGGEAVMVNEEFKITEGISEVLENLLASIDRTTEMLGTTANNLSFDRIKNASADWKMDSVEAERMNTADLILLTEQERAGLSDEERIKAEDRFEELYSHYSLTKVDEASKGHFLSGLDIAKMVVADMTSQKGKDDSYDQKSLLTDYLNATDYVRDGKDRMVGPGNCEARTKYLVSILPSLGVSKDHLHVQLFADHVQVLFNAGPDGWYSLETGGASKMALNDFDGTVILPADVFNTLATGESIEATNTKAIGFDRSEQDAVFNITDSVFSFALPKDLRPKKSFEKYSAQQLHAVMDSSPVSEHPFEVIYTEEVAEKKEVVEQVMEEKDKLVDVVSDEVIMSAIFDPNIFLSDNLSEKGFNYFLQEINGRTNHLRNVFVFDVSSGSSVTEKLKKLPYSILRLEIRSSDRDITNVDLNWVGDNKIDHLRLDNFVQIKLPENAKHDLKSIHINNPLPKESLDHGNELYVFLKDLQKSYPKLEDVFLRMEDFDRYSGNLAAWLKTLTKPSEKNPEGFMLYIGYGNDGAAVIFDKGQVEWVAPQGSKKTYP